MTEESTEPVLGIPAQYWLSLRDLDGENILKNRLDIPVLVLQGTADFQVYMDKDFEYMKSVLGHKENITPTTQESYKYTLRTLQGYFGRRPIYEIKPYDIEQFLKKLRRDGKSDSYLASARGMLYQIFHKAEANDLIRKNPVRFADKMRSREPAKRKDAFYTNEVKLMMVKLPKDRIGNSIRIMRFWFCSYRCLNIGL